MATIHQIDPPGSWHFRWWHLSSGWNRMKQHETNRLDDSDVVRRIWLRTLSHLNPSLFPFSFGTWTQPPEWIISSRQFLRVWCNFFFPVLLADRWPLCPIWCLRIRLHAVAWHLPYSWWEGASHRWPTQFQGHILISWQLVEESNVIRISKAEGSYRGKINATVCCIPVQFKKKQQPQHS